MNELDRAFKELAVLERRIKFLEEEEKINRGFREYVIKCFAEYSSILHSADLDAPKSLRTIIQDIGNEKG